MAGPEIRWKFTSDGSVNGWGWKFTVFPIVPSAAPFDMLSDRKVLSRPSIDLVMSLLDLDLQVGEDQHILPRLATALAACAQLSTLGMLQLNYRNISFTCTCIHVFVMLQPPRNACGFCVNYVT